MFREGWGESSIQSISPCLLLPPTYPARVSNPWESLHPGTRRPSPARPADPSRLERPAGGPGLTADHPAAEGSVEAEQRGAQQQRYHAAHRGAAAGVARSEGGLCPPGGRGSNAATPPASRLEALRPPPEPGCPAPCEHRLRPDLAPGALLPRASEPGLERRSARPCECASPERPPKLGGPVSVPEKQQEPQCGPRRPLGSSPRPLASEGLSPCAQVVAPTDAAAALRWRRRLIYPRPRGSSPSPGIIFNYFVSPALRSILGPSPKNWSHFENSPVSSPSSRSPLSIR